MKTSKQSPPSSLSSEDIVYLRSLRTRCNAHQRTEAAWLLVGALSSDDIARLQTLRVRCKPNQRTEAASLLLDGMVDVAFRHFDPQREQELSRSAQPESEDRAQDIARALLPFTTTLVEWNSTLTSYLQDDLERADRWPTLISLTPSDSCYFQTVVKTLREMGMGRQLPFVTGPTARFGTRQTKTSAAARRKSDEHAFVAKYILQSIEHLRRRSEARRSKGTFQELADSLMRERADIMSAAGLLPAFDCATAARWWKECGLPMLIWLEPALSPCKQGNRKQSDKERADPRASKERNAIRKRFLDLAKGRDKRDKKHSPVV